MSNCCSHDSDAACAPLQAIRGSARPAAGKARSVPTLTVKSLVRDHTRVPGSGTFSFCRTAGCDVVYFSNEAAFRKTDLKVRVGIKETEDPVPLCYCFDYTREDCPAGHSSSRPHRYPGENQSRSPRRFLRLRGEESERQLLLG